MHLHKLIESAELCWHAAPACTRSRHEFCTVHNVHKPSESVSSHAFRSRPPKNIVTANAPQCTKTPMLHIAPRYAML